MGSNTYMLNLKDFPVIKYPDGHVHIKSDKDLHKETFIGASLKNFDDVFLLAQVKKIHPELTNLYIHYMLAGRCDRRFSPGETVDLGIVCDTVASMGFRTIHVLMPHSATTIDEFKSCIQDASAYNVYDDLLNQLLTDYKLHNEYVNVISPDEGASNWIHGCVNNMRNLKAWSILQCDKQRDHQGKIIGIKLPEKILKVINEHKTFIIIDDLLDGGATYMEIAQQIRALAPDTRILLVITHAIFSKGVDLFLGHIDKIYCTNSYKDIDHPLVWQYKL